MRKTDSIEEQSASELIDQRIADLADWRGATLSRMRELIQDADPDGPGSLSSSGILGTVRSDPSALGAGADRGGQAIGC